MVSQECQGEFLRENMVENLNTIFPNMNGKGVAMIFCWGGPDFKPQTDDR
jgi:hypothetical protein